MLCAGEKAIANIVKSKRVEKGVECVRASAIIPKELLIKAKLFGIPLNSALVDGIILNLDKRESHGVKESEKEND